MGGSPYVNEFSKSKFKEWKKQIIKNQVSLRSSKRLSRWCDNFCKSDSAESSQGLSERGDIMLPSRSHGACQGRVWRCSICSHYLQWCFHYQTTENTTGFFFSASAEKANQLTGGRPLLNQNTRSSNSDGPIYLWNSTIFLCVSLTVFVCEEPKAINWTLSKTIQSDSQKPDVKTIIVNSSDSSKQVRFFFHPTWLNRTSFVHPHGTTNCWMPKQRSATKKTKKQCGWPF